MGLFLAFSDSFAHYDNTQVPGQAGRGVKWSTSGGTLETDPAHVRTGPQSLRIRFNDAPGIVNLNFPVDTANPNPPQFPAFTVGFGWQTTVLSGETIFLVTATFDSNGNPIPPSIQYQVKQFADGSLHVFTGNSVTEVGFTDPGVITVGPFWYIEFSADLSNRQLIITVTNAAGIATEVLNLPGVITSQTVVDQFAWGGPAGPDNAWVADFYWARWNTLLDVVNYGAPKIYGNLSPVSPDGFGRLNNVPDLTPFNVTPAPYFSQVNAIPEDITSFIAREDVAGFFPFTIGQGFVYDVSSIPADSTIAAIQVTHMWSKGHDMFGNAPTSAVLMAFSGDESSFTFVGAKGDALPDSPFLFITFPFDKNPLTAVAWELSDFAGDAKQQIGPAVLSLG